MFKFQKGDKVIVIDVEATDKNWQSRPTTLVGKVGVIDQSFDYPASGYINDYIVIFEGGNEIAFEENFLESYVEPEVDLPVDLLAKVSGETSGPKQPRVNYLYVVEDDDGVYGKTFDRDHARELKASYGGKKAGVIITAYAAVKEIR